MTIAGDSRRRRIVAAIDEYRATHGYPPTVREIARMVGLVSPSVCRQHLLLLEMQGRVQWESKKARTLRTVRDPAIGQAIPQTIPDWWPDPHPRCALQNEKA